MANHNDDRELEESLEDVEGRDHIEPEVTGRVIGIESGPEEGLMQLETIETPDTTNPGVRPRSQDVDDRAADAARMDVRRREHSAE